MNARLFKQLLGESESSRLDYKSAPYENGGLTPELLKDILAMANSWRTVDAYILLGVQEAPGEPARPIGIGVTHTDDAKLQQYVNAKTDKPLRFSYSEFTIDGLRFAAIHIPIQPRPFFLTRNVGAVQGGAVYIRRGSATSVANADEIYQMGRASIEGSEPALTLDFADLEVRERLGRTIQITPLWLEPVGDSELDSLSAKCYSAMPGFFDPYFNELRDFTHKYHSMLGIGFAVSNRSKTLATSVRVELRFHSHNDIVILRSMVSPPKRHGSGYSGSGTFVGSSAVRSLTIGDLTQIDVAFSKVQPGSTTWCSDKLWISTRSARELKLDGQILGDNFLPLDVSMCLVSSPSHRAMTVEDLQKMEMLVGSEP